ncbi:MAG: hypothetical protein HQ539_01845 [Parcubacteria group bacterium]|nr:hypothetical protein [Parcubacteria group bacterium]
MPEKSFIKIIPKQKEKDPRWVNTMLIIGVLLLLGIFVPFALTRNKLTELEEEKQFLDSQIIVLVREYESTSRDLIATAERINDFSKVFKEHRTTTVIFDLIRSIAHPLAQFTSFQFSNDGLKISLEVLTENFQTLGQQFLIFQQNENINAPVLSGISLDRDGFVSAQFEFFLNKELIMPFGL